MKNYNKILMLSHTYVKKINLSLPKFLSQKENIEIICVVPKKVFQNGKIIYPDYKKNEIKIKLIESDLINKSMRFQFFKNIDKIIKKHQPNIVFVDNDTVCFQSLILIYWSFYYKYKLFYFCNENNLTNILSTFSIKKLVKFLIIGISNLFIKFKVDKIFCYSNQIKNNYDFFGFKNKTRIVPLGFDREVFFSKKKIRKLKNYRISYFGRITPEKGVHVLIESLKKIKNYRWNLMIDIDHVENKNYFLNLKSDLKKNFPKTKYKFIKCDHFQIANYMRSSDIIVVPSLHEEQYGRVIQEGIACGNVAVGSNIGAIPEIINDRSLLFKPGDFNSLALILKRLFNKSYYIKKMNKQKIDIINNRSIQSQANLILKSL